jgi:hypothetical protein
MSRARDLSELTGDVWGPPREELTELRDGVEIDRDLAELRQHLDTRPGTGVAPEGWRSDLYGEWSGGGLPDEIKQELWDNATRTWETGPDGMGRSIEDERYVRRHREDRVDLQESLWREYQSCYPQLAADEAGVRRAVDAVAKQQQGYSKSMSLWARQSPHELLEAIAFEQRLQRDIDRSNNYDDGQYQHDGRRWSYSPSAEEQTIIGNIHSMPGPQHSTSGGGDSAGGLRDELLELQRRRGW